MAASKLKFAPLPGTTFGAVCTGVNLSSEEELGKAWAEIEAAFTEYLVLVFPDQHLSAEAQIAFAKRLGPIEKIGANSENEVNTFTNVLPDGRHYEEGKKNWAGALGAQYWHTDSTYLPLKPRCAMLTCRQVPSWGGQTAFADTRAAYRDLDPKLKERIEKLSAFHSLQYSSARHGSFPEPGKGRATHGEAYLRPLVETHPLTGQKHLFFGRHAFGIPGLSREESSKLLDELCAFTCQAPRTYEHNWTPGDLVVWDERCVLHRARPYDLREVRELIGTRVHGDPKYDLGVDGRSEISGDTPEAKAGREALAKELTLLKEAHIAGTAPDFRTSPFFSPYPDGPPLAAL